MKERYEFDKDAVSPTWKDYIIVTLLFIFAFVGVMSTMKWILF